MKNKNCKRNKKLFSDAQKCLVGGVNSPVRSFGYVGGNPILIEKGRGSKIYDVDGNTYIDYVLSFGALILGHANPGVVGEVKKTLSNGFCFGTTTEPEIELAHRIKKITKVIEKIRFVNSGTEAVMSAVRLARGITGRDKILKFENAYHGHADCFLVKGGSGLAALGIPCSKGVPGDTVKNSLVSAYGDKESIARFFKKYGTRIAAVVMEPASGNYGVIPPDIKFLKYIRDLTLNNGSLLIFDEVITGFRFSFGLIADELGIEPDLVCLGKIIGGGFPVGAYGGKCDIMKNLAPEGGVYQASTFGGHPAVMRAGCATLEKLSSLKGKYKQLKAYTDKLTSSITESAEKNEIAVEMSSYGTMFSIRFRKKKIFQKFYAELLSSGIYLAPSEYEANFLSFAHTEKDIRKTINTIDMIFAEGLCAG